MSPRFPYHISVAAMARSFEKMVNHDVKPPLPPPPKPTVVVPSVSSTSTTSSISTASSTLSSPSIECNDLAALLFTVWMHMNVQLAVLMLVRSSSFSSLSPPLTRSTTTTTRVSQLCLLDDIPCLNDLVDRHTQTSVASLWHEHEQAGYAKRIQMGPSRRTIRKTQETRKEPLMQDPICGQEADNDDVDIAVEEEEEEEATMAKLAQDVLSYLNQCSSSYEASSELLALTPRLQGYAAAV